MLPVRLVIALVGLTVSGGPYQQVEGTITFTATIEPTELLAIDSHDLGNGVASYVATYSESGMQDARHETTEAIAMAGDSLDFDTRGSLIARRYRHDRWPTPIDAYARR